MKKPGHLFLSPAQLREEIRRCEFCEEKPCQKACPVDCSPADFIMAARVGAPSDFKRAASLIMGHNPLGGVCGAVCPDYHCMKACTHQGFDRPVNIPAVQATIIQTAKDLGVMPRFPRQASKNIQVAIVGSGPSGIAAAAILSQKGFDVVIFERQACPGGMIQLIPDARLEKEVFRSDLQWLLDQGGIELRLNQPVTNPKALLKEFAAVIVSTGLDEPFQLGIPGEKASCDWLRYLRDPSIYPVRGDRVAIIGGGAVAVDCALTAKAQGARHVELLCLEKWSEMNLTSTERMELLDEGIAITGRVKVVSIIEEEGQIQGVKLIRVRLPDGLPFHPRHIQDLHGNGSWVLDFEAVIVAIGARSTQPQESEEGLFFAGDLALGPTTVVEAAACGKNTALQVEAFLSLQTMAAFSSPKKSHTYLTGRNLLPVDLSTGFFGRRILSPFLLSAAPPSDGYEQMKKAYEAGWAGGVMKTAFDGIPIHIPGEYMFALTENTYGNCDNVSGHSLDRVCEEIRKLIKEFPDRLTMASTGGPVTGNDAQDRIGWQSNTRKLEAAGVMGIEYSLSCPQGGDGTKGDIVSQDPELTAKIVDWVMEVSDPDIPKLFKLTGAVTSIYPILVAIKAVFERYPHKKAGITLANTFPSLAFRPGSRKNWDEGIIVGMSGEGVTQISNLTLANAARHNLVISGNGGPMNYKAAADFLALGAQTVQFCTIVTKQGVHIVQDLHAGLSHLLDSRGLKSVSELIGAALPDPITGFMELSSVKKISFVQAELCEHCGNCTRCPYLAISLNSEGIPVTDPSRCVGCSICVQKCFSGALSMRERTNEETSLLRED